MLAFRGDSGDSPNSAFAVLTKTHNSSLEVEAKVYFQD